MYTGGSIGRWQQRLIMHRNGFKASFYSSSVPVQGMWLHPCVESCGNRRTSLVGTQFNCTGLVGPSIFIIRHESAKPKVKQPLLPVWVSEANTQG